MQELICNVCPNSCKLMIDDSGEETRVTGNLCERGSMFAMQELRHPMRSICSTVRTIFLKAPILLVKGSAEVPKDRLFDVLREINKVEVTKSLRIGEVIIPNVLDLGVDIIAASNDLADVKDGETII